MVALEVRSPVRVSRPLSCAAPRDFVAIVDAAYDLGASESDWLRGLCEAAEPVLGRGEGIFAFMYELEDRGATLKIRMPTFLNCSPDMLTVMCEGVELANAEQLLRIYSGFPCQSLSQCHARSAEGYRGFKSADALRRRAGLRDILSVRAADTIHAGVAIAAPTDRVVRFAPRTAGVMAKVARHIAAARRLRQCVVFAKARPLLDVEAVLTESGKVVHAEGVARGAAQRATLSTAVRLLAEGKARFRTSHPEQVVRLWTALIDGQWSVVDSVDSDGKRYLLARKNTPELRHPNALLPTERHVASLVAMGSPIKLVAYELGLSVPAVSALLSSALRRLHLRSRTELIALFAPGADA